MSFGSGTALADTSGNSSVGGGNQVNLPISLPIDISGNSVAAAGESDASSQGGATVVNTGKGGIPNRTSGNSSVLGGNQVNAPISAPVNACGNAISLFGSSDAGCKGGATVQNSGRGGAGGNRTSGDSSLLGGNQVTAPVSAPLNACGNALAIFGDATAGCKGGSAVHNTGTGPGGNSTSGRSSALGGNQVIAPVSGPINICGNAVAVFGEAFSGCKGGSSVTNHGGPRDHGYMAAPSSNGNDTDGRFGAGSGNQVISPVSLPITACGNAAGNAPAGCAGGSSVENDGGGSGAGGNTTSGRSGVLSGNQVVAPVTAPVNVCGNAVAVLGEAFAGCRGGVSVKNGGRGAGGNVTSGRSGVGSGNQLVAPITAPVNVCGNAAAVLGLSEAHCKGGAVASPHHGVGGGGNLTSGRSGVLAGNQVIAPITAPVNVCGNAAAVLGDAAAGCLGGSHVGDPGHEPRDAFDRFAQSSGKVEAGKGGGGLLPALPVVPALSGLQDVGNVTQQMRAGGGGLPALPVVGDVSQTLGLPALPSLPGLPGQAQTPAEPAAPAKPAKRGKTPAADRADAATPAGSSSPLAPATDLVASTPVGGAVTSAAGSLPVGGLGLMSAAQPAGVTGMNSSSLLALVVGGMLAASATLFASARRFRFGKK
ncbi:chaplin [Nonomuraea sp. NN258]|uniref:chaplin family protein n=1 Tax=Nonomuraea antri TaxID=2730852 RepID=UPI0015686FE0|nr:chaplin family protein [Nonomuraea antri]NRQ30688.1 chaplin [Nonomuraea antri]